MNECAFDRGMQCSALIIKECCNCSFHKTKEQLKEGRKKAEQRIGALPKDLRLYIKDKYTKRYS